MDFGLLARQNKQFMTSLLEIITCDEHLSPFKKKKSFYRLLANVALQLYVVLLTDRKVMAVSIYLCSLVDAASFKNCGIKYKTAQRLKFILDFCSWTASDHVPFPQVGRWSQTRCLHERLWLAKRIPWVHPSFQACGTRTGGSWPCRWAMN